MKTTISMPEADWELPVSHYKYHLLTRLAAAIRTMPEIPDAMTIRLVFDRGLDGSYILEIELDAQPT
jgi:hypothetical protein